MVHIPEHSPLGIKHTVYEDHYHPDLLYPIPRSLNREKIGVRDANALPFFGFDLWNHYEVSWLNEKGKPENAVAEIIYGCDSEHIIESKSMKLYFNSLNNSVFKSKKHVEECVYNDLFTRLNTSLLTVNIIPLNEFKSKIITPRFEGIQLDDLDVECTVYHANPDYLQTENIFVEETLCSDILRSNCLVTNQPDWNSVRIHYTGNKINHEGLLRYFVSFRNDNEFHETCIEKLFVEIMERCQPKTLTILGRSTRRGGIDLNSSRSSQPILPKDIMNIRLCRQ